MSPTTPAISGTRISQGLVGNSPPWDSVCGWGREEQLWLDAVAGSDRTSQPQLLLMHRARPQNQHSYGTQKK